MVELLTPLIHFAQNVVATLGYPGVFFIAALENFFPPLPSELIFPFVGFVAGTGRLNLFLVILAGTLGALIGALFWYGLGFALGRANLEIFINRHRRILRVSFKEIEKAEEWFTRHEGPAIFLGRLVPLVRTLISVPAGLVRMPLLRFLLYSSAGSVLWIGVLSTGGFLLGERWEVIVPLIKNYEVGVGVFLLLVILALFLRKSRQLTRENSPAEDKQSGKKP